MHNDQQVDRASNFRGFLIAFSFFALFIVGVAGLIMQLK